MSQKPFPVLLLPCALLILFSAAPAVAQTRLHGDLSGTLGPGTYIVDGDCRVLIGTTLQIEPDTLIQFSGRFTWEITGTLLAQGLSGKPVVFTRLLPIQDHIWGGIRFDGTGADAGVLEHCIVEHCYCRDEPIAPDCHGGGIFINDADVTVRDTTVRFCEAVEGGGICVQGGSAAVIDRCAITENRALKGAGINISDSGQTVLSSSYIFANSSDGI